MVALLVSSFQRLHKASVPLISFSIGLRLGAAYVNHSILWNHYSNVRQEVKSVHQNVHVLEHLVEHAEAKQNDAAPPLCYSNSCYNIHVMYKCLEGPAARVYFQQLPGQTHHPHPHSLTFCKSKQCNASCCHAPSVLVSNTTSHVGVSGWSCIYHHDELEASTLLSLT